MPERDQRMEAGHREVAALILGLEGQPQRPAGRLPAGAHACQFQVRHRLVRQHVHAQYHVSGTGCQSARLLVQRLGQRQPSSVGRNPAGAQCQFPGRREKL